MFLCILSGFAIVIALLVLCFCDCVHARVCVLFKVTKSVTMNWGLFLWVGIWPGVVEFPDHTIYSFQSETVYKVRESMVP